MAIHAERSRRIRAAMQKARHNSVENGPRTVSPHQKAKEPRDFGSTGNLLGETNRRKANRPKGTQPSRAPSATADSQLFTVSPTASSEIDEPRSKNTTAVISNTRATREA